MGWAGRGTGTQEGRVFRNRCQLQIGTCQEHLPVTEQQWHLPSASVQTELSAAAAADLQHS